MTALLLSALPASRVVSSSSCELNHTVVVEISLACVQWNLSNTTHSMLSFHTEDHARKKYGVPNDSIRPSTCSTCCTAPLYVSMYMCMRHLAKREENKLMYYYTVYYRPSHIVKPGTRAALSFIQFQPVSPKSNQFHPVPTGLGRFAPVSTDYRAN